MSFNHKLLKVYIEWFNARGKGVDKEAKLKRNAIHKGINDNIAEAIRINYHKVKIEHYANNQVNLPDTVNPDNMGANLSALFALGSKIRHLDIEDSANYNTTLTQGIENAENDPKWNPKIEDIL